MADQDVFDSTPAEPTLDQLIEAANDRFNDVVGVDYTIGNNSALEQANADQYTDAEKTQFAEQINLTARAFEAKLELKAAEEGISVEQLKANPEMMGELTKEYAADISNIINSKEDAKLGIGEEFTRENAALEEYAQGFENRLEAINAQKNKDTQAPNLAAAFDGQQKNKDTQAPNIEDEERVPNLADTRNITDDHIVERIGGAISVLSRTPNDESVTPEVFRLSKEETLNVINELKAIREGKGQGDDVLQQQKAVLEKLGLAAGEQGQAAFTALAESSTTLRETFDIPDPTKELEKFQERITALQAMVAPEAPAKTVDPLEQGEQIAQGADQKLTPIEQGIQDASEYIRAKGGLVGAAMAGLGSAASALGFGSTPDQGAAAAETSVAANVPPPVVNSAETAEKIISGTAPSQNPGALGQTSQDIGAFLAQNGGSLSGAALSSIVAAVGKLQGSGAAYAPETAPSSGPSETPAMSEEQIAEVAKAAGDTVNDGVKQAGGTQEIGQASAANSVNANITMNTKSIEAGLSKAGGLG